MDEHFFDDDFFFFFSRAQGSCYIHKTSTELSYKLGKVLLSIVLLYECTNIKDLNLKNILPYFRSLNILFI